MGLLTTKLADHHLTFLLIFDIISGEIKISKTTLL